jgi:mono/diheme cytochrome c family protein
MREQASMRCLILVALIGLTGCVAEDAQDPGQETYTSYCVSCHGRSAEGDGPLADDLPVPPADLTMLAAGNNGVFPYSGVMAQIYGYPGQFHVMPEFGPLLDGPKVMWRDENGAIVETPKALLELAKYLETLQRG